MNDDKDKLDNNQDAVKDQLALAKKQLAKRLGRKRNINIPDESVVEMAKRNTILDIVLWIVALGLLVATTLMESWLGMVLALHNDATTRTVITVVSVVLALTILAFTHQGKAFTVLLKDARSEIRKVNWPSKDETTRFTWQVLLVMVVVGIFVFLIDNIFTRLVGMILN